MLYPRIEIPNIITTLPKLTVPELNEIDVAPMTSEEMESERISFVEETKKLLDMNFADKYVIIEFADKGA